MGVQSSAILVEVGVDRASQLGAQHRIAAQLSFECDHGPGVEPGVETKAPAGAGARLERQLRGREQGSTHAPSMAFSLHGLAAAESLELSRRQQEHGRGQTADPGSVGPQRLVRDRAIDRDRTQAVERQVGPGSQLTLLVRVDEIAVSRLHAAIDVGRQDRDQTVEQPHMHGRLPVVAQLHVADEAEALAAAPAVAQGEPQIVILLLEPDLVGEGALPQAAAHPMETVGSAQEGLPALWDPVATHGIVALHPQDAARTDGAIGSAELVIGLVGEERAVGIPPATSQPTGAGRVHPSVAAADDRHQERIHRRRIVDTDPAPHRIGVERHLGSHHLAHWRPYTLT